jgi:DNA polymerase I-like protein with 3'-5' exonuclease and polymerase domains
MLTVKDGKKQDWDGMSLHEIAEGNAMDVFFTLRIFDLLTERLAENPSLEKAYTLMMSPLAAEFAEIEARGFVVDTEVLEGLDEEVSANVKELHDAVLALPRVPGNMNLNSNPQLVELLYTGDDGYQLFPPYTSKKTKNPSCDKNSMEFLIEAIEAELGRRS